MNSFTFNKLCTAALFRVVGRLKRTLPDSRAGGLEITKASGVHISEFCRSQAESKRISFNWSARYDDIESALNKDILLAIKKGDKVCGIADYRYDPNVQRLYFIQIEGAAPPQPLKGEMTFISLQIAVSLAQELGAQDIELVGPFYSEKQLSQYHALGFVSTPCGANLTTKVFSGMSGFNRKTCQSIPAAAL